ncbi:hypothetical protein [Sorangium sp. So ce861]|uniref:hypothetical protein n=1 Tax=Sorangium sp. So ce861 TaxID=3133323 RepID=UPI003F5F2BCE
MVLLDGGRGSGKTALLISLLHWWKEQLVRSETAGARGRGKEPDDAPEELRELLEMTRDVVPVGIIDLQPLPRSTHLLLHVVGQFLPVVEALEDGDRPAGDRDRAPWQEGDAEEPKARTAWRRFLRAAALGWDESIADRRARLDPEAYTLELEQAERLQLDVCRAFRELVDALAEEVPRLPGAPGTPLFVISIDDADMNVERGRELLELVRTLWHPRVAFLLTGQSDLFWVVLRKQMLQLLGNPSARGNGLPASESDALVRRATELATDIYDKVVPSAHRCRLQPLSPASRLRFLERGEILKRLAPPTTILGLANFEEYLHLQVQAQSILPDRLRLLLDLANRVRVELADRLERRSRKRRTDTNRGASSKPITLPWAIARARGVLEGDLLALRSHSSDSGDVFGDEDSLESSEAPALVNDDWRCAADAHFSSTVDSWRSFCFSMRPHFEIFSTDDGGGERSTVLDAAALILLDASPSLERPSVNNGLRTFAVWIDLPSPSAGTSMSLAWPLPDWRIPLEYAAFFQFWEQIVGSRGSFLWEYINRGDIGRVARLFLAAVVEYIDFVKGRGKERPDDSEQESFLLALRTKAAEIRRNPPDWDKLAKKVRVLAGDVSRRLGTAETWWARRRAALLATPESGLPPVDANAWLSALKNEFGKDWDRVIVESGRERQRRVEIAVESHAPTDDRTAESILEEIDALKYGVPGRYVWRSEIPRNRQDVWGEFFARFQSIGVAAKMGSFNLGFYFHKRRGEALRQRASSELLQRWAHRIAPYQNDEGREVAALVVCALWDEAVKLGQAPAVDALAGTPDIRALERFYSTELANSWPLAQAAPVEQIGPRLLVAPMLAAWREELWTEFPLAKPLFELVWDVLIDIYDAPVSQPTTGPAWWDGVGGKRAVESVGLNLYPWPCADWPTFLDYELFIDAWNNVVARATQAHRDRAGHEAVADELAYWYIRSVYSLAGQRQLGTRWKSGASPGEIARMFTQLQREFGAVQEGGRRLESYAAWARALPLLAAPESGLSRETAEAILDAINIDEEYLRKLRSERLSYCRCPKRLLKIELESIDQKNPGHPWLVKIGQGS